MTSYNTGKVQIGRLYTPPLPRLSTDELRLQRALLGDTPAIDWDGVAIVAAVTLLCALTLTFWS